jgi:hypothetical protein
LYKVQITNKSLYMFKKYYGVKKHLCINV